MAKRGNPSDQRQFHITLLLLYAAILFVMGLSDDPRVWRLLLVIVPFAFWSAVYVLKEGHGKEGVR